MAKKVFIVINTAWNLVNFRSGLIRALVAQGYDVVAVAPPDEFVEQLAGLGCRYVPLHMDNGGTHPVHDALLLWRFYRLLRKERPDVFLGYTVKPNVYGSMAAHVLGIPVINNIAGLGAVFIRDGWLVRLVRWLYKVALRRSGKVFFQNPDDRKMFADYRMVSPAVSDLLPGSGINLQQFVPLPLPQVLEPGRRFRFLLIARMLWDKGVGEYVQAAQILKQKWPEVDWCLLGFLDVQNPSAVSRDQMGDWVNGGLVHYLGTSADVRTQIAEADCVVLPSYREGTPRTLLEAAAMARPIVTTDVPGCREVVEDGCNGLLCQVRDVGDLADKMQRMLQFSPQARLEMGLRGREKMEREFDEQIVIKKYLNAIQSLT